MASNGKASSSTAEYAPVHMSKSSAPASSSANVSSTTLAKLAFFTIAMICFPIGTYFVTLDRYFSGNATYAGISAAVMANVVLIAYVVAAVLEDSQSTRSPVSIKKQQ